MLRNPDSIQKVKLFADITIKGKQVASVVESGSAVTRDHLCMGELGRVPSGGEVSSTVGSPGWPCQRRASSLPQQREGRAFISLPALHPFAAQTEGPLSHRPPRGTVSSLDCSSSLTLGECVEKANPT